MTQKLPILAFLVLFTLISAWQLQNPPQSTFEEGFVPLFDGRSLDGWRKVGGDST